MGKKCCSTLSRWSWKVCWVDRLFCCSTARLAWNRGSACGRVTVSAILGATQCQFTKIIAVQSCTLQKEKSKSQKAEMWEEALGGSLVVGVVVRHDPIIQQQPPVWLCHIHRHRQQTSHYRKLTLLKHACQKYAPAAHTTPRWALPLCSFYPPPTAPPLPPCCM